MTITSNPNKTNTRILWMAVALALIASLAYVLMGLNVLGVGDLQIDERPAAVIYVAAGCYFLGGLLILLRNRWLLLLGAFINGLIILFFLNLYQDRPAVIFSPGGLVSKSAQILLEVALIYIIAVGNKILNHQLHQGILRRKNETQ